MSNIIDGLQAKRQSPRLSIKHKNEKKKRNSLLNRPHPVILDKTKRKAREKSKESSNCPICNQQLIGKAYEREKHIDLCILESHEATRTSRDQNNNRMNMYSQFQNDHLNSHDSDDNEEEEGEGDDKRKENQYRNASFINIQNEFYQSKNFMRTKLKNNKNKKRNQLGNIYADISLNGNNNSDIKCCICFGAYEKPMTSIVCWHVMCEKCWISVLKKMDSCPKCMIKTKLKDLQKIYF